MKNSKNARTMDIFVRLCEGKTIHKTEEALRFGVDERSIQRDIDDIRAFLKNRTVSDAADTREIVYDRIKKGFVLLGAKGSSMTNSEILAVTKILLESRAFSKEELGSILDKMVEGCIPLKNMKLVSDLIANEKYHYVELQHKYMPLDGMWDLGESIKEHRLLEIEYTRACAPDELVKRVVEPVAIIFSEYYFYLHAYIDETDEHGRYVHKYDYPAIFRLDRIQSYRPTGEKFQIPYASRFEEGQFRKRIQFMYPGKFMNIQLKYYGSNPEPILDRLPTAHIVSQDRAETIIEAEVYGKGIVMWLLSQGANIEVVRPASLRQEMKETLLDMLGRYDGE